MSSSLAQGVCPRADTLSRIAHACGYELALIPGGREAGPEDVGPSIVIEYEDPASPA